MIPAIQTKMPNRINWHENPEFDHPALNSPQPCPRGIHCDYKIMDRRTNTLEPACCRHVHPGEEGTGRRYFPARTVIGSDGQPYQQPACVRLTGASNGFYERRRRHMSWEEWCISREIPFIPAVPGQPFEPVSRVPFRGHERFSAMGKPANRVQPVQPANPVKPLNPVKPVTCESLEATLLSGAHSPKRIGISLNRSTGFCTPGCECVFGGECGDASRVFGMLPMPGEAIPVLTPGTPVFPDTAKVFFEPGVSEAICSEEHPSDCFCPTCRPNRLQEYWDEWAKQLSAKPAKGQPVRILGTMEPRANHRPRIPEPPTPLNLLSGFHSQVSTEPHEEQSMSPRIPLVPGPPLSKKEKEMLEAAEQEYKTPTILPSGQQEYDEQD